MTRSNGWGASGGGGRLPAPSFRMPAPSLDPALIKFAHQAKFLSVETRTPILNVIERARMEGLLECDDETACAIADFADKLKPIRI